jgi:RNA polymerase sigma-70 factor (ECF subfamily)
VRQESSADQVPTWEEIARDEGRFLYTVAYRLTGNHEDAQDLVQDVLLRVQRGLATYEPGSLHGWLSRITTNAFLDDVRKRKRRPTDLLGDEPDRVVPPAMSADDALAHADLPDHVQDALRGLPDDYRAAVVLCDVVGFEYQEIADTLEVPVGTVRSRIHRGRAQLRQVLR